MATKESYQLYQQIWQLRRDHSINLDHAFLFIIFCLTFYKVRLNLLKDKIKLLELVCWYININCHRIYILKYIIH